MAAGTVAAPWFETRGFAALLTMRPGESVKWRLSLRRDVARLVAAHRHAISRHQVLDQLVEAAPVRLAVGVVSDDEGCAGVEFLVLQVTAGEFRADHVPGEPEKLHARDRVALRGLPETRELGRQRVVVHHRAVGR